MRENTYRVRKDTVADERRDAADGWGNETFPHQNEQTIYDLVSHVSVRTFYEKNLCSHDGIAQRICFVRREIGTP